MDYKAECSSLKLLADDSKQKKKYGEKQKALVTRAHHYEHTLLAVWLFTSRNSNPVLQTSFTWFTGRSGSLQNSQGLKVTKQKQEPKHHSLPKRYPHKYHKYLHSFLLLHSLNQNKTKKSNSIAYLLPVTAKHIALHLICPAFCDFYLSVQTRAERTFYKYPIKKRWWKVFLTTGNTPSYRCLCGKSNKSLN